MFWESLLYAFVALISFVVGAVLIWILTYAAVTKPLRPLLVMRTSFLLIMVVILFASLAAGWGIYSLVSLGLLYPIFAVAAGIATFLGTLVLLGFWLYVAVVMNEGHWRYEKS